MGPMEVPSQSAGIIKIPTANYEFGANFIDPKVTPLTESLLFRHHIELQRDDIGNWYVVDAFWEDTHRWKAQCESEVWSIWQSHFEGQCTGDLDGFFYHVIIRCCHTSLLPRFCLLISSIFFFFSWQMSHICHMAWSTSIIRLSSLRIYDVAHFYFIMMWYFCYEYDLYAIVITQSHESVSCFLSKDVYGWTLS